MAEIFAWVIEGRGGRRMETKLEGWEGMNREQEIVSYGS